VGEGGGSSNILSCPETWFLVHIYPDSKFHFNRTTSAEVIQVTIYRSIGQKEEETLALQRK